VALHALSANDIVLDVAPARSLLTLWKKAPASRSEARRLASTLPYRTLRAFFREQSFCNPTDDQVVRALARPDSGVCGFGLDPAYQRRAQIDSIVVEVQRRKSTLAASIAAADARYLPRAPAWRPIRVWFLIASMLTFDAVTLNSSADQDSTPVILVNLTEVLSYGATTAERLEGLTHVLAHEAFHAGLRDVAPILPGWQPYAASADDPFHYLKFVIMDEGVGHYIDWRDRPGSDSLFTWTPHARESFAFSQLATACRRLANPNTPPGSRMEILQMASQGMFWNKYGAISGMFAAYRIEMARGLEALRDAVEAGPDEFLRVYDEVARRNPALAPLPKELLEGT
jgi:hypothetical protein